MTTNSQLRLDSKNNKWIKSPSSFQGDQIGIRQMPRYLRQGLMAVLFRFNGSTTWMILNAEGLQLGLRMKGGDSPELARWHSCHWVVYPIAWGKNRLSATKLGKTWLLWFTGSFERGGPHEEFQKNVWTWWTSGFLGVSPSATLDRFQYTVFVWVTTWRNSPETGE